MKKSIRILFPSKQTNIPLFESRNKITMSQLFHRTSVEDAFYFALSMFIVSTKHWLNRVPIRLLTAAAFPVNFVVRGFFVDNPSNCNAFDT